MRKLNKKLVLNKERIASLSNKQQYQVFGGGKLTQTCPPDNNTVGCIPLTTDCTIICESVYNYCVTEHPCSTAQTVNNCPKTSECETYTVPTTPTIIGGY